MGRNWTEEQKQVIDTRDCSLLVSAAAGSGKTAVLVERIISMITDEKNPKDIDRLLVVTFTNAAAAEMRERVMQAIEAKLQADPENMHLQKQKLLLPQACITTIDSFCMKVLREHYDEIGLDPGFRVGDPQEITLIKQDVCTALLEKHYEAADESFLDFVFSFASGKLDQGLTDLILSIYEFSQSAPWPDQWLAKALSDYPVDRAQAHSEAYQEKLTRRINALGYNHLKEAHRLSEMSIELADMPGGPEHYREAFEDDYQYLERLMEIDGYDEMKTELYAHSWKRLSTKKMPEVDPDLKERAKACRDNVRKNIDKLKKLYSKSMETMLEDELLVVPYLRELISLVREFSQAFADYKRRKNMIDFSDQEHMALQILLDDDRHATAVAEIYRDQFDEIMCDEYQDSNQVQETLFASISRESIGEPNLFTVGDIKQSIYGFRMAEPGIFLRKYQTFTKDDLAHKRIDLHMNFRSRACVLDATNHVFKDLMKPDRGGIVYDADAALYNGFKYPETEKNVARDAELLLVEYQSDHEISGEDEEDDFDPTKAEAEARAIGIRIRELMDETSGLWVYDQNLETHRHVAYGDIVILLRSARGWTESFVKTLKEMDIPAIGETSTGFFETAEIREILSLLSVIDNPLQDIPMTAVLTGEFFGMSEEELVKIRIINEDRHVPIYHCMQQYLTDGEDERLKEKCRTIITQLSEFRQMRMHISVQNLIDMICRETGIEQVMFAKPGGETRVANIERLRQYAGSFDASSYHGLFQFIRYIEKLQQADEDLGEAAVPGSEGAAVRIMTIHKSKGLEFPVCFVSGLGKNMNKQDSRAKVIAHSRYGIAADGVDKERHVSRNSLNKKYLASHKQMDNMAEEIRVLYVAMTRAREKLILTGMVDRIEKSVKEWQLSVDGNGISDQKVADAGSYLGWLGPLIYMPYLEGIDKGFSCRKITRDELKIDQIQDDLLKEKRVLILEHLKKALTDMRDLPEGVDAESIDKALNWHYPLATLTDLPGKMTVSELKKIAGEDEEAVHFYHDIAAQDEAEAAKIKIAQLRGTATHKLFEEIDFTADWDADKLTGFINHLTEHQMIPEEVCKKLPESNILTFLNGEMGKRMGVAQAKGLLYREQPFLMELPVNEIPELCRDKDIADDPRTSDARILIQGVIDVYFEEDDGIVLLDYKTDKVDMADGEEILKGRYKAQLDYYTRAIESITGKKVKDKIIYSVIMNRVIPV